MNANLNNILEQSPEYQNQGPRGKLEMMRNDILKQLEEQKNPEKKTELTSFKDKIEHALQKEDIEIQNELSSLEKEFDSFKNDLQDLKKLVANSRNKIPQIEQPNYKEIADLGKQQARNRVDLDGMQEFYETIPLIGKLMHWLVKKGTKKDDVA